MIGSITDLFQYLVSHFHCTKTVEYANRGIRILYDRISESFQFHLNGIYILHGRVGDGDRFFAAVGFNIKRKNIAVAGCI
jgi:hypothetical protein